MLQTIRITRFSRGKHFMTYFEYKNPVNECRDAKRIVEWF